MSTTAPVSATQIEDVFSEVLRVHRRTTLAVAVEVGGLVVDRFYGGRLDVLRQQGRKEISLRRLADRLAAEGSELSPSRLYRLIAIYELDQRVPLAGRALSVGHAQEVLALSDASQREWLDRAEAERWSVRQLREAVRAARGASHPRRTRHPDAMKAVRALFRASESALGALDALDAVPAEDVQRALAEVSTVRAALDRLERALRDQLSQRPPEPDADEEIDDEDLDEEEYEREDLDAEPLDQPRAAPVGATRAPPAAPPDPFEPEERVLEEESWGDLVDEEDLEHELEEIRALVRVMTEPIEPTITGTIPYPARLPRPPDD